MGKLQILLSKVFLLLKILMSLLMALVTFLTIQMLISLFTILSHLLNPSLVLLSKIKPSNLPSILGPYVPPYPTFTPISSPSSPIIPQDQQRYSSLMNSHSFVHMNKSYNPYSSTNPKSFGSNLDDQF